MIDKMRIVFTLAMALMLSMVLTGCGNFFKPNVVYKTVTVYQPVPENFTRTIKPSTPIGKVEYMALPIYERESYMSGYAVSVLKDLHSCNAQLDSISELGKKWSTKDVDK